MLKPAQLYRDELNKKYIETWYNNKYQFYQLDIGVEELNIPDNNYENHYFACVNSNDEVTGLFNYSIGWRSHSIFDITMISFIDNNVMLIRDIILHIRDLFENNNIDRIEWWAAADNPANAGYQRMIYRFGGRKVGTLHKRSMLQDGKLHDIVIYEILKTDLIQHVSNKERLK